MFITGEHW